MEYDGKKLGDINVYFSFQNSTYILLNGFIKKNNKTPDRERENIKLTMKGGQS